MQKAIDKEHVSKETRNEFHTNYPSFRYWKKNNSNKLFNVEPLNIYVHIPYCMQKCNFCYYKTERITSKDDIQNYVEFLCKEIELLSKDANLKDRPVESIYFGGGTPSLLSGDQFKMVVDALKKNHTINNPEFTIEVSSGTFSNEKLQSYLDNGINRVSMGIQSFDDDVVKMSNRKHTAERVFRSIELLQSNKNLSINIDLLSGLAGDTLDKFLGSVKTAIDTNVDMFTIYKMKTYANTTLFQKGVREKQIILPSDQEELEFISGAIDLIQESEYDLWSTFAFTRNNYFHTFIENTWRGDDLIAYGASAFGKFKNVLYQNYNNIDLYKKSVSGGKQPLYRQYVMTYKDQIIREILLCAARMSSYSNKEFNEKFGFDYFKLIPDNIEYLVSNGFIEDNSEDLILSKKGILFSDFVGQTIAEGIKNKLDDDHIQFKY